MKADSEHAAVGYETPGSERAIQFSCEGEQLIGLLAGGDRSTGFVIVVGGPQYRVGSHRMFVHLSRRLSAAGFPVFRFDARGMGDSAGEFPSFTSLDPDIRSAVTCLLDESSCEKAILLGLCDGASAASMYAWQDHRVVGLSLINPWVRSGNSESRALVRGNYGNRLLQRSFWGDLVSGRLKIGRSVNEFLKEAKSAWGRGESSEDYVIRMKSGLKNFDGLIHIGLCTRDLVAQEFELLLKTEDWRGLVDRGNIVVDRYAEADHTFSGDGELDQLAESIVGRFVHVS